MTRHHSPRTPCPSSFPAHHLLAGACLMLMAAMSHAQTEGDDAAVLDTVVVTANATAIDVKDAPASISVLTAEDIRKIPASDLNEVLRRVPGLSQQTTTDGGTSIQIRGLPQAYTLLLVDGQRMGSSSDTFDRYSRNELNWIPVESIERIEIVRGPMSALYGSDAMGGVIHVITKKSAARWGGQVTLGTEQNARSIRGDDYSGSFALSGPLAEGWRLRLNGQSTYRQSDRGLPEGVNQTRWGGGREGSKIRSLGLGLDWDISPGHRLNFQAQQGQWRTLFGPEQGDGSNPGGFASFTPRQAKMERENYSLGYQGEHGWASSRLNLVYSRYANDTDAPVARNGQRIPLLDAEGNPVTDRRGNPEFERYATQAIAKELVLDGSLSAPVQWGLDQVLTVGAQWQESRLDNPNSVGSEPNVDGVAGLSQNKARSWAVFAEDQVFLRENLSLTLGARLDDHENFGSKVSPRAYLVYHPTAEWTVRGGYSEGFKAPSLRQSNPNFVGVSQGAGCQASPGYLGGGCYTRGTSNLQPETTENWEVGAAWERGGWSGGLTFFNTEFRNKLHERALGYLNGGNIYWQEVYNIDSALTRGLEATATVPLIENASHPALKALTWTSNLTHMMKAENKANGSPLTAVPEWSFNSSLDWKVTQALDVSFSGEYIGKQVNLDWRLANNDSQFGDERIQKAYSLFDLGARYRLHPQLALNVGVRNLFDRQVGTGDYGNTGNNFYVPGRRYFVTLTGTF